MIEASDETDEDEDEDEDDDSGHESENPDNDPNADQDKWKTDLAQKASEAFYQRQSGTKSLRKIVYGKEDIEDSLNPYDAVDDDDIGG